MLYIKAANFEDIEQEHQFVAAEPADENGFLNEFSGISFEDFKAVALPRMIDWSQGKNLPDGFVPETFFFLWNSCGESKCGEPAPAGDAGDRKQPIPAGTAGDRRQPAPAPEQPCIVGEFRLRHHLIPALANGSGHVGQFIGKEYRGRGYASEGLRLLVQEARRIVPEDELYLHCNLDNQASLRVMLKNGGSIHHQDAGGYFVRIKLRNAESVKLQPFSMQNLPLVVDVVVPLWSPPVGDAAFKRFNVEYIVRNNIAENDYRFELTDENGTLQAAAFLARKGDRSSVDAWFARESQRFPKEWQAASGMSRTYLSLMDERTFSLMNGDDIKLSLFVSRKAGAGSLILERICDKLQAEGWKKLYLWTDCDCNWQWYGKHGFTLVQKDSYEPFSSEHEDYKTYIFKKEL